MFKSGVVILGGHIQGYGIARIYGELGIPSIVIDTKKINITKFSKYCIASYVVSYKETIVLLDNLSKTGKFHNWLIYPTDDYYVRLLSINRDHLNQHYFVTVDSWKIVENFFNKRLSYPLAFQCGVPIPKTIYPSSLKNLEDKVRGFTYPCIIKPAIMKDFYSVFKTKVLICNNFSELYQKLCEAAKYINIEELLIQEIIPGNSENQYSVGIFFDKDKTYNHIIVRRRRQHPIDFGNATTYAETVNIPKLLEYSEKILKAVGFSGICEVEFKYDNKNKEFKFLEVNPRLWKWHLIAQISGVPFLKSMYSFKYQKQPLISRSFKESSWRDIVSDLPIIIAMIFQNSYKSPMRRPIINAVFNWKDPFPFVIQLLCLPYLIFTRQ